MSKHVLLQRTNPGHLANCHFDYSLFCMCIGFATHVVSIVNVMFSGGRVCGKISVWNQFLICSN